LKTLRSLVIGKTYLSRPNQWQRRRDIVRAHNSIADAGEAAVVKPASPLNVIQDFSDKLLGIDSPIRLGMTYDDGRAMAL
jgi:hypothetical protein